MQKSTTSPQNAQTSLMITSSDLTQNTKLQTSFTQKFSFIKSNLDKNSTPFPLIQSYLKIDQLNFALGSIFGAFIGDSLGSYCQFRKIPFQSNDEDLDKVMEMPGKGVWNIKPGQFTDDSQLAAHLLQALSTYNLNQPFSTQSNKILIKIAEQYVKWIKSQPFDIGITTRKAFKLLKTSLFEMNNQRKDKKQEGVQQSVIQKDEYQQLNNTFQKIQQQNKNSQSNGSLMRITPMAFFISLLLGQQQFSGKSCEYFYNFIRSEINMTHGNQVIFQSSFAWVQLLVELILRNKSKKSLKSIYESFIEKYKNKQRINEWISDSQKPQWMDATECQGWARIAFTYGIKTLGTLADFNEQDLSELNYKNLIRNVISKAGDSDTNAAIVGGLIGAVLGFKKLPVQYLEKQFNLKFIQQDYSFQNRGSFYEPARKFQKAISFAQKFYPI